MKYFKFQQELLKAAEARDGWKHKPFDYPWFELNNQIGVCPRGHYIVLIPEVLFYLDRKKVFKSTTINGEQIIKMKADDLKNATDTHEITEVKPDNKKLVKLHKFVTEDSEIYINEDNLKYFDMDISTCKGTTAKNPLYVYEDGALVGLILPVNHKKKED